MKKMMVLSGDPVLQGFFHRNFRMESYPVNDVPADDAGLRSFLEDVQPELIIADIGMPRMDGIETCLRIRRLVDVPVIMLTAWRTADGKVKGFDPGSDSYLTEPLDASKLREDLEDVIRERYQLLRSS